MNTTPQRPAPRLPDRGEPAYLQATGSTHALRLREQIHALCGSWLEMPLQSCLLDAEQKLFGRAWQAPTYLDQQACMSARRRLQSHRDMLEPRFFSEVARRFEQFGAGTGREPPHPFSILSASLSLLDDSENDVRSLREQIAARSEARHASLLFELGYRCGALAGLPPLAGEDLPLSAQALSGAFLDALRDWALPAAQRVLLLEAFDRAVARELAPLYETINRHLADAGVLPHLRAYRVARPVDGRPAEERPATVEQRRAERKQANHAVAVADLIHGRSLGRLGNLSASGLLLIGPVAPRSGAVHQVRVELPDLAQGSDAVPAIELGIQEQWQDTTAAIGQVWSGFRIVSISPADTALLDTWLALPGDTA